MPNEKVESICGPTPDNFKEPIISGSNYIFENDPDFPALNLYNFFGDGATVNSFTECFYYVGEGWEPSKITIYDVLLGVSALFFSSLIILIFFKKKLYKKLSIKNIKLKLTNISNLIIKKLTTYGKFHELRNFIFWLGFALQSYFTFYIVRTKATNLQPFIDEYNSLTSNYNFFKSLDFFAGGFSGGNYSVTLTSGPISSVGSVIGWSLTNKFTIARIANFYWVYLLQLLFVFLIYKIYKNKHKFLIINSSFIILLIPWWQGSLYSLGEIPSLILFVNAIFLFSKKRKLSLLLFSVSIIFGKILNLVPFIGFYIYFLFTERSIKKLFYDLFLFNIPVAVWLFFANSRYINGNAFVYLNDQLNFILDHQSSGTRNNTATGKNLLETIFSGEYIFWKNIEKFQTLIIPIIFIILIYKNKQNINNKLENITTPFIFAITFSYIWFWYFNSTKWIRYSQHFTVLILVGLFYFLSFKIFNRKLDLIISVSLITLFIDSFSFINWFFLFLTILFINSANFLNWYKLIYFYIFIILFLNIAYPYFQKETFGNIDKTITECKAELATLGCVDAYLNSK